MIVEDNKQLKMEQGKFYEIERKKLFKIINFFQTKPVNLVFHILKKISKKQ